jgi:hypothetical protein
MNQLDLSYTLSKQVPAMDRGFTIATSYGDIVIEAGPLAGSLAAVVKVNLEAQLAELEHGADWLQALEIDALAQAEAVEHHAESLSLAEAALISAALMVSHSKLLARMQALHEQISNHLQAAHLSLSASPSQESVAAHAPWQPGDGQAERRHSFAPSAPSSDPAAQPPVAPAQTVVGPDRSLRTPEVD